MDLEKQVTNLEISKRLKELGVNQESLFYWENHPHANGLNKQGWQITLVDATTRPMDGTEECSAFTVAELGEMLPEELESKYENNPKYWFELHKREGKYLARYCGKKGIQERKLADCMGKMLIYLLENNLTTNT